ncbi:hypothetical protein KFL_003360030 [Klebsormidium nitens]|uniref:Uncharacterized protein n=1 Tax=Klebsormidium nitens TaxID=105231 RepID=A0A1Y1I8A2_KLENI|nr:hypothetical protein KFL_003360030 [Klebsormidium nitens]|eukprot:GAQ87170.1 hypothetical protein KFL_003360030 [Klebsormidium nitens]
MLQELYNILFSRRKSMGIPGAMAAEMAEELESGLRQILSEQGVRSVRHLGKNFTDEAAMKKYLRYTERLGKLKTRIDTMCEELAHSLTLVESTNKRYCVQQICFAYDELKKWSPEGGGAPEGGKEMLGKEVCIIVVAGCTKGSDYGTWWSWLLGRYFKTRFTIFRVDLLVKGTREELQDFWATWHMEEMLLESNGRGDLKEQTMHGGDRGEVIMTDTASTQEGITHRFGSQTSLVEVQEVEQSKKS